MQKYRNRRMIGVFSIFLILIIGYIFFILAKSASAEGEACTDNTFTTCSTTPTSSTVTATKDSATITWNTPTPAIIDYGKTTSYGSSTSEITSPYTLGNLSWGTTYHYQIKPSVSGSNTCTSGDKTFTTQCITIINFSIDTNNYLPDVKISWQSAVDAAGVFRYKKANDAAIWQEISFSGLNPQVTLLNLNTKTTYDYEIKTTSPAQSCMLKSGQFSTPDLIYSLTIDKIEQDKVTLRWKSNYSTIGNIVIKTPDNYQYGSFSKQIDVIEFTKEATFTTIVPISEIIGWVGIYGSPGAISFEAVGTALTRDNISKTSKASGSIGVPQSRYLGGHFEIDSGYYVARLQTSEILNPSKATVEYRLVDNSGGEYVEVGRTEAGLSFTCGIYQELQKICEGKSNLQAIYPYKKSVLVQLAIKSITAGSGQVFTYRGAPNYYWNYPAQRTGIPDYDIGSIYKNYQVNPNGTLKVELKMSSYFPLSQTSNAYSGGYGTNYYATSPCYSGESKLEGPTLKLDPSKLAGSTRTYFDADLIIPYPYSSPVASEMAPCWKGSNTCLYGTRRIWVLPNQTIDDPRTCSL